MGVILERLSFGLYQTVQARVLAINLSPTLGDFQSEILIVVLRLPWSCNPCHHMRRLMHYILICHSIINPKA